jgi:hypothetical protein
MIKALTLSILMFLAANCCAGQSRDLWSVKLDNINSAVKTKLSLTTKGTFDVNLHTSKSTRFTLVTAPTASDSKPVCSLTWNRSW